MILRVISFESNSHFPLPFSFRNFLSLEYKYRNRISFKKQKYYSTNVVQCRHILSRQARLTQNDFVGM